MVKKLSKTQELALRFVQEFLGRSFSYATDRRYLKEAKFYTNPTKTCPITGKKQRAYTVEQVLGCLNHMKAILKKPLNSIHCVAWTNKEGKSYLEAYCEPEPMPPIYMKMEVERWKAKQREKPCKKETSKPKRVQPSTSFQPQKNL